MEEYTMDFTQWEDWAIVAEQAMVGYEQWESKDKLIASYWQQIADAITRIALAIAELETNE